jgi:hypothetical protein
MEVNTMTVDATTFAPVNVKSAPESRFNYSREIGKLAGALAKAQGQLRAAAKDSANPFFKSRYADLESCWNCCREALSANGIAVIQVPNGKSPEVSLTTMLAHTSGEYIVGTYTVCAAKNDPQAVGSALTYCRRYALTAFIGICAGDDDDGNAASQPGAAKPVVKTALPAVTAAAVATPSGENAITIELIRDLAKKNVAKAKAVMAENGWTKLSEIPEDKWAMFVEKCK